MKEILAGIHEVAGYLSKDDRLKLPGEPLVRKYRDGNGVWRHAGIPGKLKNSQYLVGKKVLTVWNFIVGLNIGLTFNAKIYEP